MLHSSKFSRRG